jgi:hypothetical protein
MVIGKVAGMEPDENTTGEFTTETQRSRRIMPLLVVIPSEARGVFCVAGNIAA